MDARITEFSTFIILYLIFPALLSAKLYLWMSEKKEKLIVLMEDESCLWKQTEKIYRIMRQSDKNM